MTIPDGLKKQGAKATGENWRDNYQSPREILDRVDELFGSGWIDPFPVNPTFDCFLRNFDDSNLYINPPFSQYARAVDYLTGKGTIGPGINQQIWLLENVKTETRYAQKLLKLSSAVCYLDKRINFLDPRTGEPYKVWNEKKQKWENGSNRVGHLLIYLGESPGAFEDIFKDLGVVIVRRDYWGLFN